MMTKGRKDEDSMDLFFMNVNSDALRRLFIDRESRSRTCCCQACTH